MDLTKKLTQAGKALTKAVGAGWLACAAFVLTGLVVLSRSSGPEGVWLRRLLAEVPLLAWLGLVIAVGLLVAFLLWRARVRTQRREARAAGAQMGMSSLEPVSASSLIELWSEFRAGFRLAVRREVDRFPVVVVLGAAGSATDDVVRAYAGTDQRAAETLRAVVSGSYLNVHLGADVVVQELSSALLDEERGDVGAALRKLWRASFRRLFGLLPAAVAAPVVAIAVDPARLARMSSGEVRSAAVAVRGKLNVLSDVCRQAIEVRLLLVELAALPGYAKYVELVELEKLSTEVSLSDLGASEQLESELGERLGRFGGTLALALKQQTTADFQETLAFLKELPELNAPLSLFVRELLRDLRMSDTPDVSVLTLTHTLTSPSRFPSNPLRPGERAGALPRGYLLWPHRWATALVAVGAVSYMSLAYAVERSHYRGALAGLGAYPTSLCDAEWRDSELGARDAVRDFVNAFGAVDSSLRALPFFGSARAPLSRKEALLFRDRLLLPATAERMRKPDAVSQVHGLFLLGLVHAPGQPELKQLALGEDLTEFVSHTPFDAEALRQYLTFAPAPDLSGLRFEVPATPAPADDDKAYRDWVTALNRAIAADPVPDAAGLLRLKHDARALQAKYKQLLSWAGEHWLAYDVLDRLEAGQPTEHYRATLPQSMPRTADLAALVRDRVSLLKLVAGTELPALDAKPRALSSLVQELWTLVCAREQVLQQASPPLQCADALAHRAARKYTRESLHIPRVEGDALTRMGHLYTSDDYQQLIQHTSVLGEIRAFAAAAAQALGSVGDKGARTGDGLSDSARALLSLTLDTSSVAESYASELAPLLHETSAILAQLKSESRAHQLLHAAVKSLVEVYAVSVREAVLRDAAQVAQGFSDAGERALSTRAAAAVRANGSMLRVVQLAQQASDVADDAGQRDDPNGLFETLVSSLGELRSKTRLFENDAPAAALAEYAALLTELSTALAAGEGAPPAERFRSAEAAGVDPDFAALLSPAAQLALPMLAAPATRSTSVTAPGRPPTNRRRCSKRCSRRRCARAASVGELRRLGGGGRRVVGCAHEAQAEHYRARVPLYARCPRRDPNALSELLAPDKGS